jgi:hypothetical protein
VSPGPAEDENKTEDEENVEGTADEIANIGDVLAGAFSTQDQENRTENEEQNLEKEAPEPMNQTEEEEKEKPAVDEPEGLLVGENLTEMTGNLVDGISGITVNDRIQPVEPGPFALTQSEEYHE